MKWKIIVVHIAVLNMGYKEKELINKRLLGLKKNERLFRSNSGMAWSGKSVKNGKYTIIENARPFYGMPEGWPDLTGWKEIEITQDMVGKKVAVFYAVEVKATGKLTEKQKKFKEVIESMGGIHEVI